MLQVKNAKVRLIIVHLLKLQSYRFDMREYERGRAVNSAIEWLITKHELKKDPALDQFMKIC